LQSTYEDFQDQVYKEFKTKYTRTLIFYFQSNEASVLDHFAPKFSIYSIELELLVRKCLNLTPILGFTTPFVLMSPCLVMVI
jgi:hypothetical protein